MIRALEGVDCSMLHTVEARVEMYLLGEDFEATERVVAAIVSEGWELLQSQLAAARGATMADVRRVELASQTKLKQRMALEVKTSGDIRMVMDEVIRTCELATAAADTAHDGARDGVAACLKSFKSMASRRLHHCLNEISTRAREAHGQVGTTSVC